MSSQLAALSRTVDRSSEQVKALYEQGELEPDTKLTGLFAFDEHDADVESVMLSIEDARQEAIIRQQGREEAA